MKRYLLFCLFIIPILLLSNQLRAANETEPNNSFAQHNNLPQDTIMLGTLSTTTDVDYFKSLPQKMGTIKVYISYTGGNSGTDVYLYAYNKSQGGIGSAALINAAAANDSLIIYCRQADSVYFRIESSSVGINYQVRYTVVESGTDDIEPNNSFAQATFFAPSDTVKGRIGYTANTIDADDYFWTVLPNDGTLKVYVDKINTSNSTGADMWLYAYNKAQSGIGSMPMVNQSLNASPTDTLTIYCRKADTVYLRMTANECFSYKFRYEVIPSGTPDIEPNNSFAQATYFAPADTVKGRIGYSGATFDADDYFWTVLPNDGTLKVYVDKINTSNSTGADMWLYAFNKAQGGIGSMPMVNQPLNASPTDTLTIYCRKADTVYFRMNANDCFSYKFRYEMIPSGTPDAESNNNFAQATYFSPTDTVKGRIAYSGATFDADDYFWSVLPNDGTLKVYFDKINTSNSTGADMWLYTYNKAQGGIGSMPMVNQPLNASPTDTLTIYCRKADTVYFRVTANECFSYKFRYEVIPSGTADVESNNSFAQATYFAPTDTAKGRIGYSGASFDADDYFYSVLPNDGTLKVYFDKINTSNSTGADMWLYTYNKAQSGIGTLPMVNQLLNVRPTDTLTIYCRQADTVFFRVTANECFSYKFRYEVIPSGTADVEPNNTRATATDISFSNILHGRIGYVANAQDVNDYYRLVLPQRSKVRAFISYNNTSNSTGADMWTYFQNKAGSTVATRSIINRPLGMGYDTMVYNCAPGDTMYLYVTANECFSYDVRFEVKDEQPIADIIAARTGNDFGFTAETVNADWIEWNFDNGKTSNFKYPSQTFGIGNYNVKLRARNTGCNLIHADSLIVEVKGIEKYLPLKGGAGGDQLMTIYGGGLDTQTVVKLIKGTQVLTPFAKSANSKKNMLSTNFDLHFAQPGSYNVEITIPGQPTVTFPNGFQVDSFQYPFCKAEVIGPDRFRINSATTFELKISNAGNVYGNGAVVGFAWPKSVKVEFLPKQTRLNRNATTTVDVGGETFSLSNSITAKYADSASKPTPIDSLLGQPFNGYFMLIKIPKVPANGVISMPFKATTTAAGTPSFYAYTHHPNLFGSCETPHWSNTTNMMAAEAIDAMDMAADELKAPGLFKGFIKSLKIGQKHLAHAGASAGAHFDAWYNDYEVTGEMYGVLNAELDEANAFALQTATDELGTKVFEKGMGKLVDNNMVKNEWWNKQLANNESLSPEAFDTYLDKINALDKSTKRLEKLQGMLKEVKNLKTLNEKIATLQKLAEDCPELEPQIVDLLKMFDEELDHQDPNRKKTQSVQSMDPNAIYGPEGVLTPRFRKDMEMMHYMVTCENVDTASAPAQVVRIVDTLNPALFDLSTFEFGNVYIGNKATRLLSGRDEFFGEVSLYPEIPLYARIIAKLNRTTGVITWDMIGIDTATGKLPTDPLLGLLPPNVTKPMGEAAVNYSVKLKPGLVSGTRIDNTALIYFDENEPIYTNTWTNTIDILKPQSELLTASLSNDTIINLQFNGSDAQSGVASYKVYVKWDTTGWQSIGVCADDTMSLIGERGKTYHFYVSATDHVGNKESKAAVSEKQVTIPQRTDNPGNGSNYSIYPNPNKGELFVKSLKDVDASNVMITDFTGRQVLLTSMDFKAGTVQRFNLSALSNGVYLVVFKSAGGMKETHKLLIARDEK